MIPTEEEFALGFEPRDESKPTLRHPPRDNDISPASKKGKSKVTNNATSSNNSAPKDVNEEIQFLKDDLDFTHRRMYKMQKEIEDVNEKYNKLLEIVNKFIHREDNSPHAPHNIVIS